MIRAIIILLIISTGFFSAWGCGQSTPGAVGSVHLSTLSSLESRVTKLEKDLKAMEAARDTALTRAIEAEKQLRVEQARFATLEKDRDALQASLKARMTEKDVLQSQFDNFRKSLKDLVVQMDSAATLPTPTNTTQQTNTVQTSTVQIVPVHR